MKLIPLIPAKTMAIASAMNSGVALEELDEMIADDIEKGRARCFIQANNRWAFVDEEALEDMLYSVITMLDN